MKGLRFVQNSTSAHDKKREPRRKRNICRIGNPPMEQKQSAESKAMVILQNLDTADETKHKATNGAR